MKNLHLMTLLILGAVFLCACTPHIPTGTVAIPANYTPTVMTGEVELPFDVIENEDMQAPSGEYYPNDIPNFFVIARKGDEKDLSRYLSPAALNQIENLDYNQYLAMVVFLGSQSGGGRRVVVQRVVQKGGVIAVYADFIYPLPNTQMAAVETSPFAVVQVKKMEGLGPEVECQLIGTTIFSKKVVLPSAGSEDLGATVSPVKAPEDVPTPVSDSIFPKDAVLQHIAQREHIPVENLSVIYNQKGYSRWLQKEFWFVKVYDAQSQKEYGVQIDLSDQHFIDDETEIRSKELAAQWAKNGKLDAGLSEKLSGLNLEESTPVFIRMAVQEKKTEEVYAELAARHPEAAEALKKYGSPFAVNDPALGYQLKKENLQLLGENIQRQIQPFIDELKGQGYTVTEYFGMPMIAVTLPKKVILDLAQRSEVVEIMLAGQQEQPALVP